jgi:hypothetical protein
MPERYGPWKTCHERFRRWATDGSLGEAQAAGHPIGRAVTAMNAAFSAANRP